MDPGGTGSKATFPGAQGWLSRVSGGRPQACKGISLGDLGIKSAGPPGWELSGTLTWSGMGPNRVPPRRRSLNGSPLRTLCPDSLQRFPYNAESTFLICFLRHGNRLRELR